MHLILNIKWLRKIRDRLVSEIALEGQILCLTNYTSKSCLLYGILESGINSCCKETKFNFQLWQSNWFNLLKIREIKKCWRRKNLHKKRGGLWPICLQSIADEKPSTKCAAELLKRNSALPNKNKNML